MIARILYWPATPLALFIGSNGTVSVFKAVYFDRREFKRFIVFAGGILTNL